MWELLAKKAEEQIFWLIIVPLLMFVLLIICGILLNGTKEDEALSRFLFIDVNLGDFFFLAMKFVFKVHFFLLLAWYSTCLHNFLENQGLGIIFINIYFLNSLILVLKMFGGEIGGE